MSKAVAISVSLFHLAAGGLIAQDESEWTPRVLAVSYTHLTLPTNIEV